MRLSVVFGRFNPCTVEHEKLLDSVRYCDSDKKIIVLMGGKEAPLSLFDRLIYIRWLYPEIDIIPTTTKYFENIPSALMQFQLSDEYSDYDELRIHCGSGDKGLKTKSKQGGSVNEFKRIVSRYNGLMKWKSVTYIENERGNTSGSYVREQAKKLDYMDSDDIAVFRKLLHSRINFHEAANILRFFHS